MIPLTLWYAHDQAAGEVVRTHDELDAVLDRLAAMSTRDWPALAEVTPADAGGSPLRAGPLLYVGLHVDRGALYLSADDDPGPYYTQGEGTPDGEPLLYMYLTSDCEMPSNAEVPAAAVRLAAHEFADTGRRPTNVRWQTWARPGADTESEYPGRTG